VAHSLILGMTLSGKTTLAKKLVADYRANGIVTGVLDPMNDPSWGADFQTANADEFLSRVWQARQCAFFIDEAGESVGQFDEAMKRTATKGRHWGHRFHYLSQRGAQIARTVRDQCSSLFLFTTALDDCKIHANEWNKPELRTAHTLPQGHYFYTDRFSPLQRGQLW
jgi:hypothetical protein